MWPYQINNWPDFAYSDEIECKLNGHVLETEVVYATEGISPVVRGTFLLRALPAPASTKKGNNLFEVKLKESSQATPPWPTVIALQLPIRYRH